MWIDAIQGDPDEDEIPIHACEGHADCWPPHKWEGYKPPPGATLARPRAKKG